MIDGMGEGVGACDNLLWTGSADLERRQRRAAGAANVCSEQTLHSAASATLHLTLSRMTSVEEGREGREQRQSQSQKPEAAPSPASASHPARRVPL